MKKTRSQIAEPAFILCKDSEIQNKKAFKVFLFLESRACLSLFFNVFKCF